jgi:glycosyltransferase involved in cell wall biosynthesis
MNKTQTNSKLPQANDIDRSGLLGPVIEQYLRALDSHIQYLDDGNTTFLFMTRAGVRIRKCYEIYLSRLGRSISPRAHLFWSSRLLICKGISSIQPALAINRIGNEFLHSSLDETVKAVLASRHWVCENLANDTEKLPAQPLHVFIASSHPMAKQLSCYLKEQSALFSEYLENTIGSTQRVVIIDSGWAGTSQRILAESFPNIEWIGLYFGWMNSNWNAAQHGAARGLVFDSESFDPERPETSLTLHRHLVESMFEPNCASIEELIRNPETGLIEGVGIEALVNDRCKAPDDANYLAVVDYLESTELADLTASLKSYVSAINELAKRLSCPTVLDAELFAGKNRSADFGRMLKVSVLIPKGEWKPGETARQRIERSLWPEAQIALEFEPADALREQNRRIKQAATAKSVKATDLVIRPCGNRGRVAIITRTKDRPILLKRAAESVANQSFADYVWVVINDGGAPDVVVEVLRQCRVSAHQIILCSNELSAGMEAASNIGIRASESEFFVIHDDDDSWHPDFLLRTVAFLDSRSGTKYGAVVTHSTYVSEEIVGDRVVEWGRWPYQDWVQHIQLSELIVENFFPPIALLCRRNVAEAINLFDEQLPVLGDWDFAIRFLLRADIGVIPDPLAYYHHRDRGVSGAYSNSVVGGIAKHVEYNAIVRNKFMRYSSVNQEWFAISALMAQGYKHRDLRSRIRNATQPTNTSTPASIPTDRSLASETTGISDKRWCMIEVAKDYYSGIAGIARRMMPFPPESKLLQRIRKCRLSPPPDFADDAYVNRYADVAAAVKRGLFRSGFEHYIKHGQQEGRVRPTA